MRTPNDSHCYENQCHQRQKWQGNQIARAPVFTNGLVISFAKSNSNISADRDPQTQIGETKHADKGADVKPQSAQVSAQVAVEQRHREDVDEGDHRQRGHAPEKLALESHCEVLESKASVNRSPCRANP